MKKCKITGLIAATCVAAFVVGCVQMKKDDTHEPITMMSPFRNMSAFIEEVHKVYPEINLEVIPYSGMNYTAYVRAQLQVGDMPHIMCREEMMSVINSLICQAMLLPITMHRQDCVK